MDASSGIGWISFMEHDLLHEELQQAADSGFWNQPHTDSMYRLDYAGDLNCQEKASQKKRSRDELYSGAGSKACREKMRRDKLNDRFMELSSLLEPGKPPKIDKASILREAARIITQLRTEVHKLEETNQQLQETVKELKDEKFELHDEKLMLKLEKENLKKHLRSVSSFPGYTSHPAAVNAAVALAHASKLSPYTDVPFISTMSQWMPPSTVDISKDHVLRPPVA